MSAASPSSKPRSRKKAAASTDETHQTQESLATITLTPPHPPREDTPEYQAAHDFLVHVKKAGCHVCGVDIDTLKDSRINLFGAKDIETHHSPVERSFLYAVDWRKIHEDYPSVYSEATLIAWVDSPENLLVLCDVHHRSMELGIHHVTPEVFAVEKYLKSGYQLAATPKDAAAAQAKDEAIMRADGTEQAVQDGSLEQVEAAATAKPKTATKPRTRRPRAVAQKAVAASPA